MCVWLNVIIEETKHDIFAHHNNGTKRNALRNTFHLSAPVINSSLTCPK